jgi:ribosomal protein S4
MTKILQSRYSLFKNFEDDITGLFLFKLKRRAITRKLFAFSKILNKVEPVRLTDLLIRRKKRIKSITSLDNFKFKKIRFFYGFLVGKTTSFNKFKYKRLHKFFGNRILNSTLSFEARLDVILVRLYLFISIKEAQVFIQNYGVLVNKSLIKNCNYQLVVGDILSLAKNAAMFKRKFYKVLKARPVNVKLKDLINRELNTSLTLYTWLFKRCTKTSPFMLFGFPRYVEVNINSMEFYFYGHLNSKDISYPFKTSILDRIFFFNNYI